MKNLGRVKYGVGKLKSGCYKFANREWDFLDSCIIIIISAFCILTFSLGDIVVTGNRSFLMHTNFFDFYEASHDWTGSYDANYLPSTFWLFAIWNIPLRILGKIPEIIGANHLINITWYRILMVIVISLCTILVYKICKKLGFGIIKSRICAYAFLGSPMVFFSQMILCQYDSFTLLFVLLGVYCYINEDKAKFIFFFSIAITFKYQALIYFMVLLLLDEKRVIKIIKSVLLVIIPFAAEVLLYWGSPSFKQSVFGFGALSYVDTGINVGGLQPINLFLLLILGLMIFAYVKKANNDREKIKYSIFLINGVSFVFFGFCFFHPQWIILIAPFTIIGVMQSRHVKILLLLQILFALSYYILCVNIWRGGVDMALVSFGILKGLENEVAGLWPYMMVDVYPKIDLTYLFTAIFFCLGSWFVFSHPHFSQDECSVIESDTRVCERISFMATFLFWLIPFFICVKAIFDGDYIMFDNSNSNYESCALDNNIIYSQTIENTSEYIKQIKIYIGTFGRTNTGEFTLEIENEFGEKIYEVDYSLKQFSTDCSWYDLLEQEVKVTPGELYSIKIHSDANPENCVAIFTSQDTDLTDSESLYCNGADTNQSLALKILAKG